MYVPDPDYISSVDSSPSLSPISPLSPTSSEAELDKATVNVGIPVVLEINFPLQDKCYRCYAFFLNYPFVLGRKYFTAVGVEK